MWVGACVCVCVWSPDSWGWALMGSQVAEASGMKKHDGKTSRDLIKIGVKGHKQRKRYLIAMLP